MQIYAFIHKQKFDGDKIKLYLVSYTTDVVHDQMSKYVEIGYNSINNYHMVKTTDSEGELHSSSTFISFASLGYKTLAGRIIEVLNVDMFNQFIIEYKTIDPIKMLFMAVEKKIIIIRWDIVQQFNNSILVVDESHKMQNPGYVNKNGLAILIIRKFTKNYLIYISASILNGDINELPFVQTCILDRPYPYEKCFDKDGDITSNWRTEIMPLFEGYVVYSGKLSSINIPDHEYMGNSKELRNMEIFKHIDSEYDFNFVAQTQDMTDYKLSLQGRPVLHDSYLFMLKVNDPSTKSGVRYITTREDIIYLMKHPDLVPDLKIEIGDVVGGNREPSIKMSGPMLKFDNVQKCSPMTKTVLNQMFNHDGTMKHTMIKDEGKIRIHAQGVDFPGVQFIVDVLIANGLDEEGGKSDNNSICLACLRKRSEHKGIATIIDLGKFYHNNPQTCPAFKPIYIVNIHPYTNVNEKLARFNRAVNFMGEMLKVLVVTNVIDFSHTIMDTKYTIETSIPKHITTMIQSHKRTIRALAFKHLEKNKGFTYFNIFYDKNDPLNYTRQIIAIAEKFKKYNEIEEAWNLLWNVSSDKEMYKNTQTTPMEIDRSVISDASYYSSGAAYSYRGELITMIMQLFNEYSELTVSVIVKLIHNKTCLKNNINTKVFTIEDIVAALDILTRQTSSVDPKYLQTDIGLTVLFKMLSCNVIINNGRRGRVVFRGIDRLGDRLYSFAADPDQLTSVQSKLSKTYKPLEATLALDSNNETDKLSAKEIESKLKNFMMTSPYKWHVYLEKITANEKINIIRVAIVRWNNISDTYRNFIKLFRYSREVYYASDLKRVISVKWPDDSAPVGYLDGGEIKYYVWGDSSKPAEGSWKSTIYHPVFTEIINKANFYMFLDSEGKLKIIKVDQAKPHSDNRKNTSGIQCSTVKIDDLSDYLKKLYTNLDIKTLNGTSPSVTDITRHQSNMCDHLNNISVQADLGQFEKYLTSGSAKSKFVFERYIFILNCKKNWSFYTQSKSPTKTAKK